MSTLYCSLCGCSLVQPGTVVARLICDLLTRRRQLTERIKALESELRSLVKKVAPPLLPPPTAKC